MNAVQQPWYEKRAPKLTHWYPAWGYGPPEPAPKSKPRSWLIPGLTLLSLTILSLVSLWWGM